jgi:hypothetical protein
MEELTLGAIYDEIAERLALASSRALMGERREALGLFRGAWLEFRRFRDVLTGYPGFSALDRAFTVTMELLGSESRNLCGQEGPMEAAA